MSAEPGSLRISLWSAIDGLDGVERVAEGEALELRRAGRPFARLEGEAASFRLDPALAAAALGTPDTATSPLGPGWVVFAPAVVDRFALDRAGAWLEAAWRRAAAGARS